MLKITHVLYVGKQKSVSFEKRIRIVWVLSDFSVTGQNASKTSKWGKVEYISDLFSAAAVWWKVTWQELRKGTLLPHMLFLGRSERRPRVRSHSLAGKRSKRAWCCTRNALVGLAALSNGTWRVHVTADPAFGGHLDYSTGAGRFECDGHSNPIQTTLRPNIFFWFAEHYTNLFGEKWKVVWAVGRKHVE